MKAGKIIWPLLLAAGVGFSILLALGFWQVSRLQQKLSLIASLEQRILAPAMPLGQALDQHNTAPEQSEYLHISTTGHFLAKAPLRKIAIHQSGAGYELLQPFVSDDGIFALVSLGTIPATADAGQQAPLEAPVTLEAVLRRHAGGRGMFDAENDRFNNLWFWWDLPTMLAAAGASEATKSAPFILQRLPQAGLPTLPLAQPAKAELRNNHLGYAITWFGLAAALAGVTFAFLLKGNKG